MPKEVEDPEVDDPIKEGYRVEQVGGVLYNETDAMLKRNRLFRAGLLIGAAFLASFLPGLLFAALMWLIPISGMAPMGFVIGATAGQYAFASYAPKFFVVVTQAQAFVTLNNAKALFGIGGNPNNTFGPGTSLEWPWVTRSRRSNLSLQIITLNFTEEVPGKETQLLVKGSYQFKVDLRKASRFVGVDESTIRGGAIDLIRSEISDKLADKAADEAKREIPEFNRRLGAKFGVAPSSTTDEETETPRERKAAETVHEFEERYGISSVAVTVTGVDLPPEVQQARDAVDKSGQAIRSVASMFGLTEEELKTKIRNNEISRAEYIEMLDRTLAQGKTATMNIQAFKLGGLEGAIALFDKLVNKKGN